ncbi:glycoside hydrolase superfamily [Mycotypha africana]|uniref:glycoside hydrolase superfamily n=1 Tax=Mycotypha africana TaxID=64632 RepID=UPI0022FFED82|nr:glycoside hydrolase superfamily [Mycotypha africana]KAI8987339.1 glycoside hydrolase superfamily [Mycotypha africana]
MKDFSVLLLLLATSLSCTFAATNKVVVGYFPNWLYDRYPVSKIDFKSYTHIHYAFAIMVNGSVPSFPDPKFSSTQLKELVNTAHQANCKVLISVGGWSGSISFSKMAASKSSRKQFIDWNLQQIETYGTDGVDIDWEYPGRQGAGCNQVDAAKDVQNFLSLLKELRKATDKKFGKGKKEISMAGYVKAFETDKGPSSSALVKSIGEQLDRVNIMTYDINGAWNPKTGPNSPLYASTTESGSNGLSFQSAIDYWVQNGVPSSKLTGGLAFYGRSTTAKVDMRKSRLLYQDQVSGTVPQGDSFDAVWQDPYCAQEPAGYSGIWRFGSLISQGVLSTPMKAKAPWIRTWDNATMTPWVFNPQTKAFISYDDPQSIKAKVDYAKKKGIAGVMIWSIDQDSDKGDLLKAVKGS